MKQFSLLLSILLASLPLDAREIALTFDDAPFDDSLHFKSFERTKLLIKELSDLKTGPVMIFAVPCRFSKKKAVSQLAEWKAAGHHIASHSCTHPDLNKTDVTKYIENLKNADELLKDLFPVTGKFFRYPYLREGTSTEVRDQVREWLKTQNYKNGYVSIDNDEWIFHWKLNQAKKLGKKIDYKKVEQIYLDHILSALEFYDDLSVKLLKRSPKHVLLLHEIDSSVLFMRALVQGLRSKGWKTIDPIEAFKDPIYKEMPKNLYSNNGLIAQLAEEKGLGHFAFKDSLRENLDTLLGTTSE